MGGGEGNLMGIGKVWGKIKKRQFYGGAIKNFLPTLGVSREKGSYSKRGLHGV